jgi:hypothetical protein
MDQRIESFLADVLALAGESPDAIREGVRVALADCEAIFRAQETNKRMRDQAARVCRACAALAWPRSCSDAGERASDRLEAGAQHHRPAVALSCPSAALWLPEVGKARFMPVSQWRPHRLCWFR